MREALAAGTRLGRYEIVALVGTGGMGEVYCARDQELGRAVAIKILPAIFAESAERLRRFELEARAAAALTHPNIVAVYDVGHQGGTPYIVSELLDGQSLRARLDGSALPIRTAIEFGIQIAEGLAAAHDKGIVHRDLKPENIFVTRDERLKILDFGLAKLVDVDLGTLTAAPQTSAGAVLGTVGYLSPEQASGLPADPRSDIFSFGTILFEMVTHRRAFARATSAQTLAAVLEDDPTASAPVGVDPTVRLMNLVRRCLEKSPERRFQSARDLSFALSETRRDGVHSSVDPARRPSRTAIAALASALVVAGAVSGWIGSRLQPGAARSSPLPSVAFSLMLPQGETFVDRNPVALSPDGQHIVYGAVRNGQANLYLRKLNQVDAVLLPETSGALQPIFSPDGGSIAFAADGALKVLRLSGGFPTPIASVKNIRGASWGDDDRIVYAPDVVGGLFRVSSRGGAPEQLTEVDRTTAGSSHRFPHVLPGAGALVFMISDGQQATVSALDLRSRRRVDGLGTGHGPQYLPSGHLAFVNRSGQLSLLPFDASNLRALGPAITLQETAEIGSTGEFRGAAASSGTLAFVPYAPRLRSFAAIDRDGKERPLAIEPRPSEYFRVSPDGQSMAVTLESGFGALDIWLFNFGRNVWSRLTTDRQSFRPLWTPDGHDVLYESRRDGAPSVYRQPANPGSAASLFLSAPGLASVTPSAWLADGGLLLMVGRGSIDIVVHESARQSLRALVETSANEAGAVVSADGHWAAYASDASGRHEIHVTTIAEPRSTVQVSSSGGHGPIWAKTGNTLYFRRGNQILATTVSVERGILRSSRERIVASGEFSPSVFHNGRFDVMPDGSLIVMKDEPGPTPELRVLVNWASNALRNAKQH